MQKTKDLTEQMIVRISKRARTAIEKAANEEQVTVSAFMRRALYEAAKFTVTKPH